MKKIVLSTIVVLIVSLYANGQTALLDKLINLTTPIQSVEAHLLELEEKAKIQITYSPNQIKLKKKASLDNSFQTLRKHLEDILKGQNMLFLVSEGSYNRIILTKDYTSVKTIIRGIVLDDVSGDPLMGVHIKSLRNKSLSFTDDDGYFQISIKGEEDYLEFDLISYEVTRVKVNSENASLLKVELNTDNVIPQVLITGAEIRSYNGIPGVKKIITRNIASYTNFLGENNIMEELKTFPAIQSGSEGQTGIFVRGGGSDQNLLLYDGVPLYESSHIAGFSSIFVTDAVKDVLFFTDGFPAQYGGRLSSIVDLRLKSGKSDSIVGSLSAAITGATLYCSGPINKKLSFNTSARLSWVDLYIDPFLKESYGYDETNLGYHDLNAKLHYQLDETSSISFTAYSGRDKVRLNRQTSSQDSNFIVSDLNEVQWSNKLIALNYNSILSDKWVMNTHISRLRYKHSSRGKYGFVQLDDMNNIIDENIQDVISYSSITDINAYTDLSYHHNEKITFKLGGGRILHEFNPTIRQSEVSSFDNRDVVVDGDSSFVAREDYLYGELVINAFDNLDITAGVRSSFYKVNQKGSLDFKKYSFTEPRLSLTYSPKEKHYLSFSFNQMVQYNHLLINPSAGLPADLWVPSTEIIQPEFAKHYTFGYSYLGKTISLSINAYQKNYDQLLEYANPFDLFFSVVNSGQFIPVYTSSNEWERRVESGTGIARGAELNFSKAFKKAKFRFAYAYGKSTRSFAAIDNGKSFPFTFDRTHDINVSANFDISPKWDFAVKWVYGTSSTFTLVIEEFLSPEGIKLLRAEGRNNYRNLPFHHLDANFNRVFLFRGYACRMTIGVYNAYNRLNPFYSFVFNNPELNRYQIRQVSLFPVIPHVSFKINW